MDFEKISHVIAETLGCEIESVKMEATLAELGADSLAAVELMMAMEEATGVAIEDEAMSSLKTVGDIMDYLAANNN